MDWMAFAAQQGPEQQPSVVAFPVASSNAILTLTNGVARGDEVAAREFFEGYGDRLFRYALVLARGNEDAARETLSIAMIKAVRGMRAMGSEEDLWRWLTRIATTTFIDHCRKNNRRVVTTSDESIAETVAASNPDQALTAALAECLAELPNDEREIVEGFYFEDASQTDLAAKSGSSRKAIESRLARIRQKLRASILRKLS